MKSDVLGEETFWADWEGATEDTYLGEAFDAYVRDMSAEGADDGWDKTVLFLESNGGYSGEVLRELGLVEGGFAEARKGPSRG